MSRVNITFSRTGGKAPVALANGRLLKVQRNKFGVFYSRFETSEEYTDINISILHELSGRYWWLIYLIFFVISVFGLLNPRYDKSAVTADIKLRVCPEGAEQVNIDINMGRQALAAGRAEITSDCKTEVLTNIAEESKQLSGRIKFARWLPKVFWIAAIVTFIILMIKGNIF